MKKLSLFIRALLARAYPRTIGQLRERTWTIFGLFLPILSTSGFVMVYRGLNAPEEYIGFVILGGAVGIFWTNILWGMCSQLYWEKEQGNLPLMVMAPAPLSSILVGMATGGLIFSSVRAFFVTWFTMAIFNIQFTVSSWPLLLLVFILTMGSLYGMGMAFSSLFLILNREAWHLSHLMMEPVYLISGFYFPVRHLGPIIAGTALLIPITAGMDAIRQIIYPAMDFAFLSLKTEIIILVALLFIFLSGSFLLLEYIEKKAIENGGIIESRR